MSSAALKAVKVNEGARMTDDIKEELKWRAKKAKERFKFSENTTIEEDDKKIIVAKNARNNARDMNVVATRAATDTKEFRGEMKHKANKVAVKSKSVKPSVKIDGEKKVDAIKGNKAGLVVSICAYLDVSVGYACVCVVLLLIRTRKFLPHARLLFSLHVCLTHLDHSPRPPLLLFLSLLPSYDFFTISHRHSKAQPRQQIRNQGCTIPSAGLARSS